MVVARKKPVEVEVHQFDQATFWNREQDWPDWIAAAVKSVVIYSYKDVTYISTLEGDHRVTDGDWIIQGVHGELYPCKPDIFAKTYDLVEECPTCGASPGDECRGCDD
jgi:hypothetical protein